MTFAIMNLLRICVREIDVLFASTLTLEDVIGTTVEGIIAGKPGLKSNHSKVVSKARSNIKMNYGERFPLSTVTKIVESLLA
jgi:hypothetical protein